MQLMTEREKYEQWIRDLEAKKDSTPAHVFDRVHADYKLRLDAVVERLEEHTTAMQEHARALMKRLKELEDTEQNILDEQTEQELRAKVGEITESAWETASKKAERELNRLRADQRRVADDLSRISQILGGEPAAADDSAEAPRRSTDFDELEFLKSVVGTPTGAVEAHTTKVGKSAPQKAAPAAPPAAAPAGPKAAPQDAPKSKADAAPKTQAPSDGGGALGIRTSGAVEQPKTLKCAECGAMNYASEWYCERCGAELTVV